MPAKTIASLISASGELKTLTLRARALEALQALYASAAPRELAAASRVKGVRAGTLVVTAQNSAVAAKLRQLAPSILASIRDAHPALTGVRFEVQVAGRRGATDPAREKLTLSAPAVERFAELAGRIPPGSLKSALERLVRHHRRGRGSSR